MKQPAAVLFSLVLSGLILLYITSEDLQTAAAGLEDPSPTLCPLSIADGERSCAEIEEDILASTVRVLFRTRVMKDDGTGYLMYESVGHGTVKEGNYLVTHNHTGIPLSIGRGVDGIGVYTHVLLFDAEGAIRYGGPIDEFTVVKEDAETMVLAHKVSGFLGALGFASAEFQDWEKVGPWAGMEVAQIDWDGERSRVDWVSVSEFSLEAGVPRIELADGARIGASGGGIFWQGVHIGNNWRVIERLDEMGNVISQTTTVALNSRAVANRYLDIALHDPFAREGMEPLVPGERPTIVVAPETRLCVGRLLVR